MGDSATQIVSLALQLKEGAYTRVEYDLAQKPRLYAVDQQGAPKKENKVKMWKRKERRISAQHLCVEMVFSVKGGKQNYLLKVDENELKLEETRDKPDIASLTDSYWFCVKRATVSEQYKIHSKPFPTLCLIIKEEVEKQWLFDLGDSTTTSSIAVLIPPEKISW